MEDKKENIPSLTEVLNIWLKPGTSVSYPMSPIIFKDSPLSPVKQLEVRGMSNETDELTLLHQLHTKVRES